MLFRFAPHLLLPNRFGTLLLRLFFGLAVQPVLGLLADPFRKRRGFGGTSICVFLGFSFHFETGLQFRLHFQRAPRTLLRFGTCPGLFLQSNPLFLDGAPIFGMTAVFVLAPLLGLTMLFGDALLLCPATFFDLATLPTLPPLLGQAALFRLALVTGFADFLCLALHLGFVAMPLLQRQ